MNLRTKFFSWIVALVTIGVVGVGAITIVTERRLLQSELDQHERQMVERLAKVCEESLYQNDLVFYNYFKTLSVERGFLGACFLDSTGKIHIHSNTQLIGGTLNTPHEKEAIRTSSTFTQTYKQGVSTILDLAAPVTFANERVGTARIFLSQDILQQFIDNSTRQIIQRTGIIMLIILFLSYAGAWGLAITMVRPIQKIVEGMRRISKGQLELIPFPRRKDELGWMGKELNITIHKLKELEEMKRDFVAGITHELRSPLIAIEGLASRLLDTSEEPLTPDQREFLITVQNNASRLMRLINDLLTTARLEANREEFKIDRVDAKRCLQEIHQLYHPQAKNKGLDFHLELTGQPVFVLADEDKLLQVLNNLVSNAIKFTKKGTITIGLISNHDKAVISVSDTGVGIPAAERAHLFEKFFRGGSNAKNTVGTGLGLFIAKSLVEGQGGTISVKSNANNTGTTFTIALPISEKI